MRPPSPDHEIDSVDSGTSLMRTLNGVVLALIGLSVLAQSLRFIQVLRDPGNIGTVPEGIIGVIGVAIMPGMVLAFGKLVVHILRGFKRAVSWGYAVVYLLILLLPFLFSMWGANAYNKALQNTADAHQGANEEENEQYYAGVEWAKQHNPHNNNLCRGDYDFNRGCWKQIELHRVAQTNAGIEWAKQNLPEKPSLCKGSPRFVMGCRTYFDEHLRKPTKPGGSPYDGMTTKECTDDVQGSIDALNAVDAEEGEIARAEQAYRMHWGPILRSCASHDTIIQMALMPDIYARLDGAIEKLKAGQTVSDAEHAVLLNDFTAMSQLPVQPYTTAYMNKFDEYSARKSKEFVEPVLVYPDLSCSQYQAKISEMRQLDKERSAAMEALKRGDGVVIDGKQHRLLNQQRIAMLSDWKLYNDGANARHCDITPN